ncbi:Ovarian cancer-associated protein 2 [Sorochytrium milnesiophthora]
MAADATQAPRLLRILCLHGYLQSGGWMRARTAVLRKSLAKTAEFVYIDAPHVADHAAPNAEDNSQSLTWCNFSDDRRDVRGFDESVAMITKAMKEQGPFDGLLGFSQGALMAAALASMLQPGSANPLLADTEHNCRFVILCGGFVSQYPGHAKYFELGGRADASSSTINMRSLHIWGESDALVVPERSEKLCALFTDAARYIHPGGHLIPTDAKARQAIRDFLEQQHVSITMRV